MVPICSCDEVRSSLNLGLSVARTSLHRIRETKGAECARRWSASSTRHPAFNNPEPTMRRPAHQAAGTQRTGLSSSALLLRALRGFGLRNRTNFYNDDAATILRGRGAVARGKALSPRISFVCSGSHRRPLSSLSVQMHRLLQRPGRSRRPRAARKGIRFTTSCARSRFVLSR